MQDIDASVDRWAERNRHLAHLLAHVARQDHRAFAELYQRTSARLFGIILRIHRDRSVAEDVLQEVFVNVWHAAGDFDPKRSQPLTWLTSVARNRAIDELRRERARPRREDASADHAEDGDTIEDRRVDPEDGPMNLLGRATEARALADCIGDLSAPQRQSVALAFYDGLSHAEVADRLREPLGTVKSWIRRALQVIKDCLESAGDRAPPSR